jgi:hypothetical protein
VTLRDLHGEHFICFPRTWAPSLHDSLVRVLLEARVDAGFEASEHLSTTQGMVAAGLALTFSAAPWLEGVEGIVWRPLADARIEIRTGGGVAAREPVAGPPIPRPGAPGRGRRRPVRGRRGVRARRAPPEPSRRMNARPDGPLTR